MTRVRAIVYLFFLLLTGASLAAEPATTSEPVPPPEAPTTATDAETETAVPVCSADDTLAGKTLYRQLANCEAAKQKIPAHLVMAVMEIESAFVPESDGVDGEVGLMQVKPDTAALLGFTGTPEELREPLTNIRLGTRYLAEAFRLADGDLCTTVMKYRAGHDETRFSVRSVDYCIRARAIYARDGIAVEGIVPEPSFGFGVARNTSISSGKAGTARGTCISRSFMPGPNYRRCIRYASSADAKKTVAARRRLFAP